MNKFLVLILVFILLLSGCASNDSPKNSQKLVEKDNSYCAPPFKEIAELEIGFRLKYSSSLRHPLLDEDSGKEKYIKKYSPKRKEFFEKNYFENLLWMKLFPFSCHDENFKFRLLILEVNSSKIAFLNTSLQIFEDNGEYFIRASIPFPSPASEKYSCYGKNDSPFLIYKLSKDEKEKILGNIEAQNSFDNKFKALTLEDVKRERGQQPTILIFEGVNEGKYFSAYSEFFWEDELDSLAVKSQSDNELTSLARGLFSFFYDKLLNGDVRNYEPGKGWNDLVPFESCRRKETSLKIQALLKEKKKKPTQFYEIIFDQKTLEGKGDQCHNLVEDYLTSLPEIKRCSKDSDCVIFPPMKNFIYKSVNNHNTELLMKKQKAINKECFNDKAVNFINSGPLDRLISYCSNDGYCGDFDTAEENFRKNSYLDDDGNTVEEITRIDSSEKTKTTIFRDKSVKVEISYGNIRKIIITDASGKTVKYEECNGDKCVDKTEEFKKNTDNIFDE